MRPVLLFLITLALAGPTAAQIDFSRYFDPGTFRLLTVNEYEELDFKWDMKGTVQVHLNEGLNNLREGFVEIALQNLTEVIQLDSSLSVAYYYRGICLRKMYLFNEAESDFLTCIRLNSKLAQPYLALGVLYHLSNKLSKAASYYEKTIKADPSLAVAYCNQGHLALSKRDPKKALRYYQKCKSINPRFAEAYLAEGIVKLKGNMVESIPLFKQAIDVDSACWQAYFFRGLAYLNQNQTNLCLSDWNRVIQFNRTNSFFLLMRGFLYIEMGNFDRAFSDMRKAMEGREVNPERYAGGLTLLDRQIDLQSAVRYLLRNGYGLQEKSFDFLKKGFCLLLADRSKEALENIKKAGQIEESATAHYMEALVYEHLAQPDSALHYYNKALELDNDIFDAHKKRAMYRHTQRDWKGAFADFNEMVRIEPQSAVPYRLRGNINFSVRQYAGAIIDFSRYLKFDSTDVEVWQLRSESRTLIGDSKGANEDLCKILALQPDDLRLYRQIGANYLAFGDTVKATMIFREYSSRTNMQSHIPHLELARIYTTSRQLSNARLEIDTVQKIVGTSADDPELLSEIHYLAGLVEFHQTEFQKAISKFNRALEWNPNNVPAIYYRGRANQTIGRRRDALADYKHAAGYLDAAELYRLLQDRKN